MIKFKIVKMPSARVNLTINSLPVVLNQEYNIALQNAVQASNVSGFRGEPLDTFKYKIVNNNVTSVNEGTVKLNYLVSANGIIPISNVTKTIALNDEYLLNSVVPYNNGFDRIKIITVVGQGDWLYKGNLIVPNQILMWYDLHQNLKFIANDPGAKAAYNELIFLFGKELLFFPTQNKITTNVTSIGELILIQELTLNSNTNEINNSSFIVKIEKGIANAPYQLSIDTSKFTKITNPDDFVSFRSSENISITNLYNTKETVIYNGNLDNEGAVTINGIIQRKAPIQQGELLKITLNTINNLTNTVNQQKKIITFTDGIEIVAKKVYFYQQININNTLENEISLITNENILNKNFHLFTDFSQNKLIDFNLIGKIIFVIQESTNIDYIITDALNNNITNQFNRVFRPDLKAVIYVSKNIISYSKILFKIV